jgi:LmbE family N-acetylglucosaminyl deacetylase
MGESLMTKALVIAAHPDDEVLGCGGTILNHTSNGDEVYLLTMTDGESSRHSQKVQGRVSSLEKCCEKLGINSFASLDFPDNAMDSISLLEITKKIEDCIRRFSPDLIYTHHAYDLNIDHQKVFEATITACRPQPGCSVKEIRCFEVLSSTSWSKNSFMPNLFVDISKFFDQKIEALKFYDSEMREWPHERSYHGVKVLAERRGCEVGVAKAEAFYIFRKIISE